jgi:hypothetical protein
LFNTIIHGDNLEVMRAMPADYVDLVMCSPPYEAARTYSMGFDLKGQAWVDWMVDRCKEMARVCKGLCVIVCEGQTRQYRYTASPILLMADLHRAGFNLRKPPIFHRVGIPGSGGPDWLRNDYEFCVAFTRPGKLAWSDNTACGHPPKWAPGGEMSNRKTNGGRVNQWGNVGSAKGMGNKDPDGKPEPTARPSHLTADRLHTKTKPDGEMEVQGYSVPVLANPGNVIKCVVGGGVMGSKLAHENEAPYPESLCEFFVKSFCPPDGVVLDPFSGSGTTVAVAEKNGRKWIGIDVRDTQVDLSKRRIQEVARPLLT